MCLVGVALNVNSDYPLVVVANRDESHARATAPAARWEDATDIVGGRDLESGGTWQGVSSSGRVGMVINYAGRPKRQVDMRSRGELVHDWLAGGMDATTFIATLRKRELEYAGFCLIIGNNFSRIDFTGYCKSEFHFIIFNAVPSDHCAARFPHFIDSTQKNAVHNFMAHGLYGKADN